MKFGINPDNLAFELIERLSRNDSIHEALPAAIRATTMEDLPPIIPSRVRLELLRELAEHLKPRRTLTLRKNHD